MKFMVGRASLIGSEEKPCDEAVYERTGKDEFRWFVELDSLEDFALFCQKYGSVLVEPSPYGDWYVEIYDLYIHGVT